MEILTRQQAFEIGSNKYFTGVPCKHGHVSERYTQTCVCVECHKAANAKELHRSTLRLQGIRPLTLKTHPADHASLAAYADMLNAARGIKVTNLTGAPQPPTTPAPARTEITDEQRLAMWTRVHGETIARQMLEMYHGK